MLKNIKGLLFCTLLFVSWHAHATFVPPNTILYVGQSVTSENGNYTLVMQTDGNLVLYRSDGAIRFATYKYGNFAAMQGDGNFVEYNSNNQPLWHTVTQGNPGAFLNVQTDGNLVVYSSSGAPLWNIGADLSPGTNPSYAGDVVGRDMNYSGLGWLGHIGIWDGGMVAEAVNGNANAIRFTSLSNFKNTSAYWGTASANIPNYSVYSCFAPQCTNFSLQPWGQTEMVASRLAIAKRAYQSYLIGADYTFLAYYTSAWPGDYFNPARRGVYRCDTFVIDMLAITVWNQNSSFFEPIDSTWSSRFNSLFNGIRTPKTVFDTLKTFK